MNVTIVGANGEVGLSTIAALTASSTKFVSYFPSFLFFILILMTW
jgi:Flp pilus assembly CpaE family ATPase